MIMIIMIVIFQHLTHHRRRTKQTFFYTDQFDFSLVM